MKKHRLILLLGILVALVFFYFGLNTWMKSQEEQAFVPPPIVKKEVPNPSPPPKPAVKEEKPEDKVEAKAEKKEPKKEEPVVKKEARKLPEPIGEEKKVEKKVEKKEEPVAEKPRQKAVAKATPVKKQTPAKPLKSYVVQVGAYVKKSNADNALKTVKKLGYRGFLVREDNFYKVRVKLRTANLKVHLAKLRSKFPGAYRIK